MENQTADCFNCNEVLPNVSTIYFCPNCASQLRCKDCEAELLPKANVCINCGNSILKKNIENANLHIFNEIDFEQKGTQKKFRSKFTNEVGNTLAETFAAMVGGNIQFRKLQNPFTSSTSKGSQTKQINNKTSNKSSEVEEAIIITDSDYDEVLLRHFKIEDQKLKLINTRVKHTGKLDQTIRISLLALYAFEKAEQSPVEKSSIVEILTSASLYNNHFQSWFSKCDEIVKDGSKIQLSVPGREVTEEILKEIADDSIIKGAVGFSKTSTKGNRRSNKNDKGDTEMKTDPDSAKSKRSKGPIYYLDILIKEGYFSQKRKLGEFIEHLKINKAESYAPQELSTPLKRMIKSGKLKREKNREGQYEYFA